MKKEMYFQELEKLLYDIPVQDREEALQFYKDYLEDAGPDAEEEVLRSLGTAKALSESIRQALHGNSTDEEYCRVHKELPGEYRVPFSSGGRFSGAEHMEEKKEQKRPRIGKWILLSILILCAAPILVPICVALFAVIFAVFITVICTLLGIVIALGASGAALLVASIVVIIVAIVKLLASPLSALIMLGGGFLMVGLGLLSIAVTVWIAAKIIPAVCKGVMKLLSKIFKRR